MKLENVLQAQIIKPAIQLQDQVDEAVRKNMQASRNKIKAEKITSGTVVHTFVVRKRVLRSNVRSQQRKGGKLDNYFFGGPFTIISLQGKSSNLINDKGVEFAKINLVPFFNEEP